MLSKPGDGSLSFWVAVDIVIAQPISWLPLVADYNRFARRSSSAFWGTFIGYTITNTWFYALGAMILLAAGITQETKGFVESIALTAGWLALLILLVDETDGAWADLYSAAVSVQNVFPKVKQRWLIFALGVLSLAIALVLDVTQYENFLFLIGSVFVPLFGILAADYFLLRKRKYQSDELYRTKGAYWYNGGVNAIGLIAWAVGIAAYHITNPATLGAFFADWPKLIPESLTGLGGSIPSFVVASVVYWVLALVFRQPNKGASTVES